MNFQIIAKPAAFDCTLLGAGKSIFFTFWPSLSESYGQEIAGSFAFFAFAFMVKNEKVPIICAGFSLSFALFNILFFKS